MTLVFYSRSVDHEPLDRGGVVDLRGFRCAWCHCLMAQAFV